MRLFNRSQPEEDPNAPIEGQDPQADPQGGDPNPPAADPIEPPEEPWIPEGTDLDTLYAGDGSPLYVDADGRAVDGEGYLIPPTRPQDAVPTAEPTAGGEPAPPARTWQPLLANGLVTEQDIAEAESLGIAPEQVQFFQKMQARVASHVVAASRQQQKAAAQAGVPDALLAASEDFTEQVPVELRGTPQGARIAAYMAIEADAAETGDLRASMEKFFGGVKNPTPQRERSLIPASAVPTSPRANPDVLNTATRGRARMVGGLREDQVSAIQAARKPKV